jgi:hypothetical protein
MTSHEDLSIVLIQSTLVITNSWHVLDDDRVVRMLALLVENRVGFNHVIHNVGLGDFLGAELPLGTKVLSIIVAKMIVAGNGSELDTSTDQEVDQGRLHLGLARLKVVTTNERVMLLSKLNGTRNKCVLWGTIDERDTFEDTSHSKDSGWGDFLVAVCDSLHEVLRSIINTRDEISETLGIGSPLYDDLVQVVRGLEVTSYEISINYWTLSGRILPDILANLFNMLHASLAALNEVVGTILLVGSNEIWIVDAGKRNHGSHLLLDLILESGLKNSSSVHGLSQVQSTDIPATNHKIIWMNHGQDVMERNIDILGSLSIGTKLDCRSHDDRTIVISSTRAFTSFPDESTAVGNDASSDSGTIVSTPSNKHHTGLGDLAINFEVIDSFLGGGLKFAIGGLVDQGGAIRILGSDLIVGVDDVWRIDFEEILVGRCDCATVSVREVQSDFRVRCHDYLKCMAVSKLCRVCGFGSGAFIW